MPEIGETLIMPAQVLDIYKPRKDQLIAAELISKGKPRFCVLLKLALLAKRNGNGHRLPLDHTKNAIAALGDKLNIPGDLNHTTAAKGTSTRIWIDEDAGDYALLMLEGLFWSRYFNDEEIEKIKAEHKNGDVGASWEIDWPYELLAAEDEPETYDVTNFGFSGFCLTVGVEPAEEATKGQVIITATKGGDAVEETDFWELYNHILDEERDILATLMAEEPDQDFLERFFYELDNDCLEAAQLTYQQRKDLPDSAFAYVKTETGKSGKKIKIRRFPIHDEAHRKNCVGRLPQAKGLTAEEKAQIFRKCLSRGKSAGDQWVAKYKGWDTSVYPPKEKKTAMAEVGTNYPGDLPLGFLSDIKCPVCGYRFGNLKQADLEKLEFKMQCSNPDEAHRFVVSVNVRAEGKNAEYRLSATSEIGDLDEFVQVTLKNTDEEVNDMAEMNEERVKELIAEALSDQNESAETKAKAEKDRQADIDAAVAEKLDDAREQAVKEYKEKRKLGASRSDIINEIVPYETAEAKAEAIELLAEMSQEEFERHQKDKEKDKELAELKAKVNDGDSGDGEGGGDGEGDPDDLKAGKKNKPSKDDKETERKLALCEQRW